MSTTTKTVLGIAVVAVIALIAVFALRAPMSNQTASTDDSALTTSPNDTSDAALAKDSAAVDTQLNGLDKDSATVDQGVAESQI